MIAAQIGIQRGIELGVVLGGAGLALVMAGLVRFLTSYAPVGRLPWVDVALFLAGAAPAFAVGLFSFSAALALTLW